VRKTARWIQNGFRNSISSALFGIHQDSQQYGGNETCDGHRLCRKKGGSWGPTSHCIQKRLTSAETVESMLLTGFEETKQSDEKRPVYRDRLLELMLCRVRPNWALPVDRFEQAAQRNYTVSSAEWMWDDARTIDLIMPLEVQASSLPLALGSDKQSDEEKKKQARNLVGQAPYRPLCDRTMASPTRPGQTWRKDRRFDRCLALR
jgi:hypothetical protein